MNQISSIHSQVTTVQSTDLTPLHGENESHPSIVGHAIFRDNPFSTAGNYTVIEYREGATVDELVNFACLDNSWLKNYIHVQIGDVLIPKEKWNLVRLKKNAPIKLLVVPQGGGGGGKNILRTIAMIAVVVVAAYYAPTVAGYMGITSAGGVAAVSAGLALVGTLALNAVFPPPKIDTPSLSGSGISSDPTFGFSQTRNTTKPYSNVPRVYGRNKVVPNYAAKPFIESNGSQQWMYLLFDFGHGPLQLEDLKIGENALSTYTGLTYAIHPSFVAGDSLSIYNKDVEQEGYSLKLANGIYRTVTTVQDTNQAIIDFQFPQGIGKVNTSNGNLEQYTVQFSVDYRPVGSGSWSSYESIPYELVGSQASVQVPNQIKCTGNSTKPFFVSLTLNFPTAGEYEIRSLLITTESTSQYVYDDVYLAALRSVKNAAPIAPKVPHTIVEMKVLATEQLNGVVDEFSAIATSILPVWNGISWSNQATRNPAWIYADVLRGQSSSSPIPDSRIDLAALLEWANWCSTPSANEPSKPKAQCDFIINGSSTSWQVLKLVSATGDATPTVKSGKYSVSVDKQKTIPVQLFTPRNCTGFSAVRSFHEQPDALRVQFVDPDEEWQPREILVYDDGKNESNSTKFESIQLTGITNYHQAWRLGRRALAQGRLRQETYTITTGVENLLASRGDLVRLAYDVPKIGKGWGRVSSVSGQQISLDENFTVINIGDYLRIRKNNDIQSDFIVTAVINSNTVEVSGSLSAIQFGQLAVYGPMSQISLDCLVKSVTPMADLKASIEMVAYAPEIYTAETTTIPPYSPLISTVDNLVPGPISNLIASQNTVIVNRYPYVSVSLSWIGSPPGAVAVGYEVYEKQNGNWVMIGVTQERTFFAYSSVRLIDESGNKVNLNGKTLEFAVIGVSSTGQKLTITSASTCLITITGDTIKPDVVTYFDVDIKNSSTVTLDWGASPSPDVDYYQIRYSPEFSSTTSFEKATVIADKVPYPGTSVSVPARFGTYMIKTIDTSGNISQNYSSIITPTKTLFDYQEIQTLNSGTWTGDKFGLQVYETTKLRSQSSGVSGEFVGDGYYYFPETIDFGAIYPVRVSAGIVANGFTATETVSSNTNWDAWMEVRTGTDISTLSDWGTLNTVTSLSYGEGDFGPWKAFHAGDFTGYLLQFRLRTHSDDESLGVNVTSATIEITSQYRVDGAYDVSGTLGGVRVNFSSPYQVRPSLSITQQGMVTGDYFELSAQDKDGFTIEFFNSSGTSVTRTFDWVARGIGRKVLSIPT